MANSDVPTHPETSPRSIARDTALRPVTIRQALSARMSGTDADFNIDGHCVRTISIVANVIEMTHIIVGDHIRRDRYVLDDGTSHGRITASNTLAAEEPTLDPIPDYVYVLGTLFNFHGTNIIRVGRIYAIEDPHQIHSHLLEAMAVTTAYEKGTYAVVPHVTTQTDTAPPSTSESRVGNALEPESVTRTAEGDLPALAHTSEDEDCYDHETSSNASDDSFHTAASVDKADDVETDIATQFSDLQLNSAESDSVEAPRSIGRDPYSHLSALQRDILLQLFHAADQPGGQRLHVTSIRDGVRRGPWASLDGETIGQALDDLVAQNYLAADNNFLYYGLKPLGWNYAMD